MMNSYNNDNVRIVNGTPIPVPADNQVNEWHFTLFTFVDNEIVNGMKTPSKKDIKEAIEDKQAFIWMHSFKQVKWDYEDEDEEQASMFKNTGAECLGSFQYYPPFAFVSSAKKIYASLPTGVLTPNGSLIPHPFPDTDEPYCELFSLYTPMEEYVSSDEWKEKQFKEFATWKNDNLVTQEEARNKIRKRNHKLYFREPYFKTVSHGYDDKTPFQKTGAFSFYYKITKHNPRPTGTEPMPSLEVWHNTSNLGENEDGTPNTDTAETNYMRLVISPFQDVPIKLYCNGNSNEGSFKRVEKTLRTEWGPQACQKEYDRCDILFLFNTYFGMLVTNDISVNKYTKENSFIVNTKHIKNPFQTLGITNITPTDKMIAFLEQSKKAKALEIFPTIVKEDPEPTEIRLKVKHPKETMFGPIEGFRQIWDGCVGESGYLPMYFSRALSFTIFFKGMYAVNGDQSAVKYYAYPVVNCYNDMMDASEIWSGISRKGAKCIEAKLAYVDHGKQEAVYYFDIQFKAKFPQRYPIECFGVVIAAHVTSRNINIMNGNGVFSIGPRANIRSKYPAARRKQSVSSDKYLGIMSSLSVNAGLDGINGQMVLDGYPLDQGIANVIQDQLIGEVDLKVDLHPYSNNPNPDIFKGFGMEMSTSNSNGAYKMSVELKGTQQKLMDMKIIACPFFDGDELEKICQYVEDYAKIPIRMMNYTISNPKQALPTGVQDGWLAKTGYQPDENMNETFRVPRSTNFESPAIAYPNGVSCFDLLKDVAQQTGCIFSVGMDGIGYMYELNELGVPYILVNQMMGNVVRFDATEIIGVDIAPSFENRFTHVSTFAMAEYKSKKADTIAENVRNEVLYPMHRSTNLGDPIFPWSKHTIQVVNGYLSPEQLTAVHHANILSSTMDRYDGSITVLGNTKVYFLFQLIKISNQYFYVTNISHNIDLQTKMWTTSYQVNYFNEAMAF